LGQGAGQIGQNTQSIAIGLNSGQFTQGLQSVAIGNLAGQFNQGQRSVAIGSLAGYTNQAGFSVAIGSLAGYTGQNINSIAIGNSAGQINQGQNSIAIGNSAGNLNQANNSIVINASGSAISGSTSNSTYVAPIRNITQTNVLGYNTSTNELTYWAKTFVVQHPKQQEKYLVHACLEGPEAGVYYRGKSEITNNEYVEVSLPDYVDELATDFTVNITSIYVSGKMVDFYTTEIENNKFRVYSKNGENGKFYWTVFGKRLSIDVEVDKDTVKVRGDGPYTYISP